MDVLQPWQAFWIALASVWLLSSPAVLGSEQDFAVVCNSVLIGIALFLGVIGRAAIPRGWWERMAVALGLWLGLSPWVFGAHARAAQLNGLASGLVVVVLALWARRDRRRADLRGERS